MTTTKSLPASTATSGRDPWGTPSASLNAPALVTEAAPEARPAAKRPTKAQRALLAYLAGTAAFPGIVKTPTYDVCRERGWAVKSNGRHEITAAGRKIIGL